MHLTLALLLAANTASAADPYTRQPAIGRELTWLFDKRLTRAGHPALEGTTVVRFGSP